MVETAMTELVGDLEHDVRMCTVAACSDRVEVGNGSLSTARTRTGGRVMADEVTHDPNAIPPEPMGAPRAPFSMIYARGGSTHARHATEPPSVGPNVMALSPAATRLALELASETARDPIDTVMIALSLYRAALEAKKRGETVGSAENADVLDQKFVNF